MKDKYDSLNKPRPGPASQLVVIVAAIVFTLVFVGMLMLAEWIAPSCEVPPC